MNPGRLNHRVTLQRPGGTRDAVGERQTTWTDVATVWANVAPTSTAERMVAAQARSFVTHRVTIRYGSEWSTIDGSWRIKFGARYMPIEGVRNLQEGGRWLELVCTEGGAEE
mgnify:CR=1 FL=1